MFKWRDAENKFRYNSGSWISSTINACFPGNLDRVGMALVGQAQDLHGSLRHLADPQLTTR